MMVKLLIALTVGVFVLVVWLFPILNNGNGQTNKNPAQTISNSESIYNPVKLEIPKLAVIADIEKVGLDSQGRMDVPKNINNVSWYQPGYKPGELGNSVLAGHIDSVSGPAIFYNLASLDNGDVIRIIDEAGKTQAFTVTAKEYYLYDQVPLMQVFGPSDHPRLNLITCDGQFNQATRNYSHRLVVYSEASS